MRPVPDREQRHFSRISFGADVLLCQGQDEHSAELLDIALKGALVALRQPAALLGKSAELKLNLGEDGEVIVMEGVVVHQEGLHVGIECRHIDLDSLTRLRRLAELNLGDEELLDRELFQLFSLK